MINEGPSPLIDTIGRKINANLLSYGFPWSLAVVAIVRVMVIGFWRRQWSGQPSRLPVRSAFALLGALIGSFVAYAINDSGIVVLCLVAVFVGPYLLVEYRKSSKFGSSSKLEVVVP